MLLCYIGLMIALTESHAIVATDPAYCPQPLARIS